MTHFHEITGSTPCASATLPFYVGTGRFRIRG
nr:MAG TPA: hypothetical protein [Caudoviricetes sp.]